jgi:hypothetical protein
LVRRHDTASAPAAAATGEERRNRRGTGLRSEKIDEGFHGVASPALKIQAEAEIRSVVRLPEWFVAMNDEVLAVESAVERSTSRSRIAAGTSSRNSSSRHSRS